MKICDNPILELANAKAVYIIQEIELLEILTGCESKNRYNVYMINNNNENVFLFKCKEESSCITRLCCK